MRFPRLGRWVDDETGDVLLREVHSAETFWHRFLGLQFAAALPDGTGLLLRDCRSVHTFWMRFPIDIAFLDDAYRVVETQEAVRPWRVVAPKEASVRHVVESNPGLTDHLRIGKVTRFE